MPLLGYAGYLPFGVECALVLQLVARLYREALFDLPQDGAARRPYSQGMQIPLQISLHGIERSNALYNAIHDKTAKLERYYDRITSCRVVLELDARHKHKGRQFTVRIDLKVPGGEIAVTREHGEDVQIALRDAFDAARRQLEDYARGQRGDVKRHAEEVAGEGPQGRA